MSSRDDSTNQQESGHWWNHSIIKWICAGIAAPVLVWGIQRALETSLSSRPDDGPPILVDLVQLERSEGWQANNWVFPRDVELKDSEIDQLNKLPRNSQDEDEWFRRHGAVDPYAAKIKIVLRGNRNDPVRLVDMRPISHCRKPLKGTLFLSGTAGSDSSVIIQYDLDHPSPKAKILNEEQGELQDYFAEKTINLARDETITLEVVAKTEKHYCDFTLTMDILSKSTKSTHSISSQGKPFKVTGVRKKTSAYHALYISGLANQSNAAKWTAADPETYKREGE